MVKGSRTSLGKEFTYENRYLFLGRAAGVGDSLASCEQPSLVQTFGITVTPAARPPRPRISKAGKQRGAAARSAIAVSAYGAVLELKPAGGGRGFLSARLKEFGPRLTDLQKALYLSAIGLLRAQHASSVSLLHRIGYVKDTIAMLDQAKQLSGGQVFVVNWIAGVVHTELPELLPSEDRQRERVSWCAENADKAPHAGWLREVYYHLGKLALADGDQAKAEDYLRRSGYKDWTRPITLITPFSEDVASGHTFSPRRITEIVPGRVYALSGFEFTEYYFVVSDDRRELIGIDAGTRPDSAKVAYETLRV